MKKRIILLSVFFMSVRAFAQLPSHVSSTGLLGWYPFTGNANDLSAAANHGTVMGASLTTDAVGTANSAYLFTPTNNIVTPIVPASTVSKALFADFNASVITNLTGSGSPFYGLGNCLLSSDLSGTGGFAIGILNGKFSALCGQTWTYANYTFTPGIWYKVGANFNASSSTVEFYVNGSLIAANTVTQFPNITPTNFKIGYGDSNAWGFPFDGKIDNVGIWNRVLTNCEIQELYMENSFGFITQPVNQSAAPGSNITFVANSSFTNAVYQWQTDLGAGFNNLSNAGQYSGVTSQTLTVSGITTTNNNQVFRCLISSATCSQVSNQATLTILPTGINEINQQENVLALYPNPSNNQINIRLKENVINANYIIYDALWRELKHGEIIEKQAISVGELPSGIYYLQLKTEAGTSVQKFIRE